MATFVCGLPDTFGYGLVNWDFGASMVAGTIAVTLTIIGYRQGSKIVAKLPLISGEKGRMKKQVRLTAAMLTVSCLDFALVVVPNTLSLLANATPVLSASFTGYSNMYYSLNASVAIVCHLTFNTEFRLAAIKILRLQKRFSKVGPNMVTAIPQNNVDIHETKV